MSDQVRFLPTKAKFISRKVSNLILLMHPPSAFHRDFLQPLLCSCSKQSALHTGKAKYSVNTSLGLKSSCASNLWDQLTRPECCSINCC